MEELCIVKIGGNVLDSAEALSRFLTTFSQLKSPKILLHGGGKIATKLAAQLGIETQMVEGRRITDEAMRDVVTMVYGGLVNKQVVAALQARSCDAIGLTGADGSVIEANKRPVKTIDYGFVGDVTSVDAEFIQQLLQWGKVPVFAPLTLEKSAGVLLNTNADTQASAVAVALANYYQVKLIYCFEKRGVLADVMNDNSVISSIQPASYQQLKERGVIYEGMIPKLDNAFAAVAAGVEKVIICHADELAEAVNTGKAGTTLQADN